MPNQHILLVDDDRTLADMYSDRLKAAGYEVSLAYDGEAGLQAAQTKKPDLILLDILMPKMNGLDVLKVLKEDQATQSIPVVLLTALIQDIDKNKGLASGAVGYLVKSETMPGELVKKIGLLLEPST